MPSLVYTVSANVTNANQGFQQVAQSAGQMATAIANVAPAVSTASQALAQSAVNSAAAAGGMQQLSASAQAAQSAYASIANTAAAFTQSTASMVQAAQAQANGARAIANGFTIIGQAAQQSLAPLTPLGRALQQVNQSTASSALSSASVAGGFQHIGSSAFIARQGVQNLSNVFRDLPFILNNPAIGAAALDHIVGTVNVLREETGSLKGAFGALGASLLGGGGLVVGINLALAAFSIFSSKMSEGNKAVKETANAAQQAADAANKAAASQFESVSKLVSVSEQRNLTLKQQQKILQDLQNINSAYFGSLTIENGLIIGLSDAYAKYADNIFKVAKAKGSEDQIKSLSEQLVGVTGKLNDANAAFQVNTSTFGRIAAIGAKNIDDLFKAGDKVNEVLNKTIPTFEDIQFLSKATGLSETDINNKLLVRQKLRTEELRIVGQIGELSKFVNAQEGSKVDAIIPTKAKDNAKQIEEVLSKLIIDRDELAKNPLLSFDEKDQKDFELLNSAITRLRELKVDKNNPIVIGLRSELSDDAIQIAIDKFKDRLKKTGIEDVSAIPIPISFELRKDSGLVDLVQKNLASLDKLKLPRNLQDKVSKFLFDPEKFKEATDRATKYMENTASFAQKTLDPIFSAVFDNIGNGAAKTMQAVGDAIKGLITQLIRAAAEAAVLSLIMNAIFPGSGGKFSFGAMFSGLSGIPKFAEGGLVAGPTVGLLGEGIGISSNNPEVVAPLNKLRNMLGDTGGMQAVVVTGQITGNNINLANSRTQNTRRRLYGK